MAHDKIRRSGPYRGKTLEVEFPGEFEFIFETALDHESKDQLGTLGETTLDTKNLTLLSLKLIINNKRTAFRTAVPILRKHINFHFWVDVK
jgi:hypothetical protein